MAYVTMNADTLRQTIRDITDLDADDVPDSILDLYIRDGYYRILDLEKRWTFLEVSFSFQARTGVRAYTIADLTSDTLSQVSSIVDNTNTGVRLANIGYDEAESTYIGAYDTNGDPLFYSVWAGQIHLYPKPESTRTLVCRGYREPFDWQTDEGDVDASPNLHFPLVYYACSRIYQQLEDPTMSQLYKQSFDEGVALARKNVMEPVAHHPIVLSSGLTRNMPSEKGWLQRLGKSLG